MDELQPLVAAECAALAGVLDTLTAAEWEAPSLCRGWRIREVVAHVTMPARYTPEQFGAEMAAAGGDFGVLSNRVATRDAGLPAGELVAALRTERLQTWAPPGGGYSGALSHVVIHGVDATVALGRPRACSDTAARLVLGALVQGGGRMFDVDLAGKRLITHDLDFSHGQGQEIHDNSGQMIALLARRTLPDGRSLEK